MMNEDLPELHVKSRLHQSSTGLTEWPLIPFEFADGEKATSCS